MGFYGISAIVGYLMPNPLYTYILIYRICFSGVLWHISHCRLFNAKSSLYIYIKYIGFVLVGFYGISTIVCYLCQILLYIYIKYIGFVFSGVLWHISHCRLFNANPLYTYILNI